MFIIGFISKLFSGIFSFFVKNPMLLVVLAVGLMCLWIGSRWGYDRAESKYLPVVQKYEAEAKERQAKIEKVEADSKLAAEEAKAEIAVKQAEINRVSDAYERRIADMTKNPKVKTVTVTVQVFTSGTTTVSATTTLFVEDGQVSCRRLPSEYVRTINEMIDIANGKITNGIQSSPVPSSSAPARISINEWLRSQPTSDPIWFSDSEFRLRPAEGVQATTQSKIEFRRGPEEPHGGGGEHIRGLRDTEWETGS